MNTLKLPLLLTAALTLSACALPPGYHYEHSPQPGYRTYTGYPVGEVIVVEQPQAHRVYPLMRDKRLPAGSEFYENQYGNRYLATPEAHRHEHHWPYGLTGS